MIIFKHSDEQLISTQMLSKVKVSDLDCYEILYSATLGPIKAIGQDFVYNWQKVNEAAMKQNLNLDSYITLPIAARLIEKHLSSHVTFWYLSLQNLFIITVCSKRYMNFMNPLHSLHGYAEYGQSFLRQNARPIIYWDGKSVYRIHPVYGSTPTTNLITDFGSLFGLSVTDSNKEQYEEILTNPLDHFDYSAVPSEPGQTCHWNGKSFIIRHSLCLLPDLY